MRISDIFNVYITKDSSEIFHHESHPFAMLDKEQQELFMVNFKKLLSGQFDEKLFELDFQPEAEDPAQLILHRGFKADHVEEWKTQMLRIVGKMLQDVQYEQDRVVTFIRGEYYNPTKRRNEETDGSEQDEVYAFQFI